MILSKKFRYIRESVSIALILCLVIKAVTPWSIVSQQMEILILIILFLGWSWFIVAIFYEQNPVWEKRDSLKKIWFLIGIRWFAILFISLMVWMIISYINSGRTCGWSFAPFLWSWEKEFCSIFEYLFTWINGFTIAWLGWIFLWGVFIMFLTWVIADFFVTKFRILRLR